MAMRSRRIAEGDRKNVYRMFTDIGEIVMFVLVMALLVPFVPAGMFTAPLLFLTIAIGVAVVALLARDALKSSYVRFLEMVISSGREDGAEEEE